MVWNGIAWYGMEWNVVIFGDFGVGRLAELGLVRRPLVHCTATWTD